MLLATASNVHRARGLHSTAGPDRSPPGACSNFAGHRASIRASSEEYDCLRIDEARAASNHHRQTPAVVPTPGMCCPVRHLTLLLGIVGEARTCMPTFHHKQKYNTVKT